MNVGKKIFSIVLTMAMVITTLAVIPAKKAEAKVVILYGKSLVKEVGDTDWIYVKQQNKAKFTSSNKKIATVNKRGEVKAIAPGTCKITIKIGKSKKKATIKVLPKAASIKGVSISGSNSATSKAQLAKIKATWKKSKGATGYYVYYSKNEKSGYKKLTVKGGSTTSLVISNLEYGNTYYIKVQSFAKVGKKTIVSDEYSKVKSAKTYMMVWNDEFNGNKVDTKKWTTEGATGAGGYGNYELQNYQPEYTKVEKGAMVIMPQFDWNTVTKKDVKNSHYSSKWWTKGIVSFKYGKVEFRAKVPLGEGTWAATWMLGDNFTWPRCGEIDVMETTFAKAKTSIPQTIHCPKFNGMSYSTGAKHKDTTVPTATTAYHTYGIEWTEKEIRFYIDGKFSWSYNPSNYVISGNATSDSSIWPYNQPFHLILNCAVGGTLGVDNNAGAGNVTSVNPAGWTKIGEKVNEDGQLIETYQDYMYIDYVRVYQ